MNNVNTNCERYDLLNEKHTYNKLITTTQWFDYVSQKCCNNLVKVNIVMQNQIVTKHAIECELVEIK